MSRPTTKSDLLTAAAQNYEALNAFVSSMTETELSTPFDFSSANKKEAHWARDKNLQREMPVHAVKEILMINRSTPCTMQQ